MRYRKLIPKPSLREQVSANRRWLDMMADSVGHERMPVTQTEQALAVRRTRIRRPSDPRRILEKHVLKAGLQFLRHHPKVASVERTQSGVFTEGNRTIRVGFVGKLDISGFLKGSARYFEVDAKRPGGKLSEAQIRRIRQVQDNGGIAGSFTCVEELQALIEE